MGALLAWGVILSPYLLILSLLVKLVHPRGYLTLTDCVFIAIPTSQAFASLTIFLVGGFAFGTISHPYLLTGFTISCFLLTTFVHWRSSGKIRKVLVHTSQTGLDPLVWILALTAFTIFYNIFQVHTLNPLRSEAKDVTSSFERTDQEPSGLINGYATQGATWSDLPFHLGIINSFRFGVNSKDFNPISVYSFLFSKVELAFSLLPDFHSAVLCVAGFNLREAIVVPSSFLSTSLIVLLFIFARKFSSYPATAPTIQGTLAGLLSVLLVVFAGGLGGFAFLAQAWTNWKTTQALPDESFQDTLWRAVERPLIDADHIQNFGVGGKELFWFSFIYHMLVPQRCPVYSYPLFLSCIILLWCGLRARTALEAETKPSKRRRKEIRRLFAWAGLVAGLSPLMQSFTFTATWVVGIVLCVWESRKWFFDVFYMFHWIGFFVPLFVVGYMQVSAFLIRPSLFQDWGSLNWKLLWTDSFWDILSFFTWWFYALGLFVYIFAYSGSHMRGLRLQFYIVALAIFVFGNVAQLAVWNKDNIKMLYCWHFLASTSIAHALVEALSPTAPTSSKPEGTNNTSAGKGIVPAPLPLEEKIFAVLRSLFILFLVFVLIFSGVLMVLREPHQNYKLYSQEDLEVAQWVRDNTAFNDVFLTSESHIQPATTLAGRSQVTSFNGWMWSHGYASKPRQDRLLRVLACSTPRFVRAMMKKYGVGYVIIDEKFRSEWEEAIRKYIDEPPPPLETVEGEEEDKKEEELADGELPERENDDDNYDSVVDEEEDYDDETMVDEDDDYESADYDSEDDLEDDLEDDYEDDLEDDLEGDLEEEGEPASEPSEEAEVELDGESEEEKEERSRKKRERAIQEKKQREKFLQLSQQEKKEHKLNEGILGCAKANFISVFKNSQYEILKVDLAAFDPALETQTNNASESASPVTSATPDVNDPSTMGLNDEQVIVVEAPRMTTETLRDVEWQSVETPRVTVL